uniref:Ubiquitin-conjugating enzyme E2Q-like protein 1 n=1 Tax=Erpetoichthys calabaricus TaxID=27687 RepID=A0A8C4T1Y5_ERPCA
MKELQEIKRLADNFISVELADDNLFEWNVKLHQVDKDSALWQDMKETNTEYILLNITFPDNFPFSPPFMRVLTPRLENGYVLDGGAICMELLTPRGWSSAYTVEAVMRQFAASLVKGQVRRHPRYQPYHLVKPHFVYLLLKIHCVSVYIFIMRQIIYTNSLDTLSYNYDHNKHLVKLHFVYLLLMIHSISVCIFIMRQII